MRHEEGCFSHAEHTAALASHGDAIAAARERQQTAFAAERERWKAEGLDVFHADQAPSSADPGGVPAGAHGIAAHVPGNVWKLLVEPGQRVVAGETIAILESMKMEIAIPPVSRTAVMSAKPSIGSSWPKAAGPLSMSAQGRALYFNLYSV